MKRPKSQRKTLATYGPRRIAVRVVEDPDAVMVVWREHGLRRQETFPKTANGRTEARAWAQGFSDSRSNNTSQSTRITVRALWDRYRDAEFGALRERSKVLYRQSWEKFELFAGKNFFADDLDVAMMGRFRSTLEKQGLGLSMVRHAIDQVKRVYAYGDRVELLNRNRARLYKFRVAKDDIKESPAEYRTDEAAKILAELDPTKGTQWRAFVAVSLCINQGVRQRSALNLKWVDVDFENDRITWVAKFSKTGVGFDQPLRPGARKALEIAREWHTRTGIKSPWVLPSGSTLSKRETYSPQTLWTAVMDAEKRAKIEHKPYRAAHGFRRMLAGNVAEVTGNPMLALQSIGDRDPKQLARYVKKRDDQMADAFRQLDGESTSTQPERSNDEAITAETENKALSEVIDT